MSAIDLLFTALRSENRKALMPFVTAGDPDLDFTSTVIQKMVGCGASLVEVGIPYSDPIADGPVIQASYTRALENGLHVDDIFAGVATLAEENRPPLVAMVAYSIIFRSGVNAFLTKVNNRDFPG